jgi:VWFA-related protein
MRGLRSRSIFAAAALVVATACAAAQQQGAPITTLHARGGLVVVDVAVTDKQQNPVHHLNASDFALMENGAPQQVKHFEEHVAMTAAEAARLPPMPHLLPGYFSNYSPAPAGGTVNVLLLDALNTPMKDQAYVRDQLLEYLKNAPVGAPIAIFGFTGRLILLQGFSSDPAVLKAAVLERGKPEMSQLLDDPLGGATSASMTDFMRAPMGGGGKDPMGSQLKTSIQQNESQHISQQLEQRMLLTLTAMDQLARYLEGIPGRKNLVWFSGSFPLSLLPDGDLADPFSVVANAEEQYRETTNLLARGQIAVYPIDARGVLTSAVHAASNPMKSYAGNPHAFAKDQAKFFQDMFAAHDTMLQMAKDTGGRAFVDTDGLTAALGQAIRSGSDYYTISYTPSDSNWNGKYRKIEVKLKDGRNVTLAYRRGYFADDPDKVKPHRESAEADPVPQSAMSVAMMRGAPPATEILMKVRVLPATVATEATVADGNTLNPDPKLKLKGPFRRFAVDMEADIGGLSFAASEDGRYRCPVEFVTFVYDREGTVINAVDTPMSANLTAEQYKALARTGLPFHAEISVPVGGDYFLRTAVMDRRTGRVGSVELPVAAVEKLSAPVKK